MVCQKCKREIAENSNFCPYCGKACKKNFFSFLTKRNRLSFKTKIKLTFFLLLFSFLIGVAISLKSKKPIESSSVKNETIKTVMPEKEIQGDFPDKFTKSETTGLTLEEMLQYYESFF